MDNMKKLKTPCFNFYPESFLGGIRKMTDKEVGIYIKALCYQFNEGAIDEEEYQAFPKRVKDKFILTEKGFTLTSPITGRVLTVISMKLYLNRFTPLMRAERLQVSVFLSARKSLQPMTV